jgi:hypothetical protein
MQSLGRKQDRGIATLCYEYYKKYTRSDSLVADLLRVMIGAWLHFCRLAQRKGNMSCVKDETALNSLRRRILANPANVQKAVQKPAPGLT